MNVKRNSYATLRLWLGLLLLLGSIPPVGATAAPTALSADLSLTIQDTPDPVTAGAALTYHLHITNLGPDPATGVTVAGVLPEGAGYDTFSAPAGVTCTADGQALTCALGILTKGQTVAVDVFVAVDPGARTTLRFAAVVAGNEPDPVPANNSAAVQTQVNIDVNLELAFHDVTPVPAIAGAPLTYALVVTNTGYSNATQVVLTDTLPAEVQVIRLTPDQGACEVIDVDIVCTLDVIGPQQVVVVPVEMRVDAATRAPLAHHTRVDSLEPDAEPVNNARWLVLPLIARSDLRVQAWPVPAPIISGTLMLEPPVAGRPLGYLIHAENLGPSDANAVSVHVTLPPDVTLDGGMTSTLGACVHDDLHIVCTPGYMTAGFSGTLHLTVTVDASFVGTLALTATIAGLETDPFPDNNSVVLTVPVATHADLSLLLSAPATVNPGGLLAYRHVISNAGPSDAAPVLVTDTFPSGVTFDSAVGADCAGASDSVILPYGGARCTLDRLAPGDVITFTVYGRVDPAIRGTLLTTATVTSPAEDLFPDDNTATVAVEAIFTVYLPLVARNAGN